MDLLQLTSEWQDQHMKAWAVVLLLITLAVGMANIDFGDSPGCSSVEDCAAYQDYLDQDPGSSYDH